jgi:starch synthase
MRIIQNKVLKILFAASEAGPFIKTGGLGDVASALPDALAKRGNEVLTVIPRYGGIDKAEFKETGIRFSIDMEGKRFDASVFSAETGENCRTLFIDQPELFGNRPNPYGDEKGDFYDNDRRFIFFNRALIELSGRLDAPTDIFHLNDWQCGLAPLYLELERRKGRFKSSRSIFTIHNLAYQGHFPKSSFNLTALPENLFGPEGVEQYGKLALLKSAILFADGLTTVSPTYAKEILSPEFGFGLETLLKSRSKQLKGILNGIDTSEWDPQSDPHIASNYSAKNLSGKEVCRASLLREFGIPASEGMPVVGMVSRLIEQKGFDIVMGMIENFIGKIRFVLLGTGQREYEGFFKTLATKYPDSVGLKIGYDNRLAHLIEAGSDIFLMPSKFEPCGLNQMFSLRYGTVPVVRSTGGLNDTVKNWNRASGKGNGFVFKKPGPAALAGALRKAVKTYSKKGEWKKIVQNGMKADHSWEASAAEYEKLYRSLL